jgi:hypothetical protein
MKCLIGNDKNIEWRATVPQKGCAGTEIRERVTGKCIDFENLRC